MKLYTEEQFFNTVKAIQDYLDHYDEKEAQEMIEKHLKALKPIELPSDEEIEDVSGGDVSFELGAQWLRNKIQNGNNE